MKFSCPWSSWHNPNNEWEIYHYLWLQTYNLLSIKVAELSGALRGEIERVSSAAEQRKQFEEKLADVQSALQNMASEDLAPYKEQPLMAAAIEKDLTHLKVLDQNHVKVILD